MDRIASRYVSVDAYKAEEARCKARAQEELAEAVQLMNNISGLGSPSGSKEADYLEAGGLRKGVDKQRKPAAKPDVKLKYEVKMSTR